MNHISILKINRTRYAIITLAQHEIIIHIYYVFISIIIEFPKLLK